MLEYFPIWKHFGTPITYTSSLVSKCVQRLDSPNLRDWRTTGGWSFIKWESSNVSEATCFSFSTKKTSSDYLYEHVVGKEFGVTLEAALEKDGSI